MRIPIKILGLLDRKERISLLKLVVLVFLMTVLDILGIVSIMPFMALLTNPDFIFEQKILHELYSFFEFGNHKKFLAFIGLCILIFYVFCLSFKAYVSYLILRFTSNKEFSISTKVFNYYLKQPYSWYLQRNTADLSKTIMSDVSEIITFGMLPLLNVVSYGLACIAILFLIVILDPFLALISSLLMGGGYFVIFFYVSKLLKRLGEDRSYALRMRFNVLSECFGGIKDVKLRDIENSFSDKFSRYAKMYTERHATAQAVGMLPRFALEGIAFGGLLFLTVMLTLTIESIERILPVLTLYAFSAFRLIPALNQVYYSITQLKFVVAALDKVEISSHPSPQKTIEGKIAEIKLEKSLVLENVCFRYESGGQNVLEDLSIDIMAGSKNAFIGPTGSGKSTAVDLIVGLLEPNNGKIISDGTVINSQTAAGWKKFIGYVPQTIYLSDDTILANIAYGVPEQEVDLNRAENAARVACIHDFIVTELELGYQSRVGERGVRFSGGQRQRIGIARALYSQPKLLILDEATSALDIITELKVMNEISKLSDDITIIMIAHRLQTIENCDKIFYFENGKVELISSLEDKRLKIN